MTTMRDLSKQVEQLLVEYTTLSASDLVARYAEPHRFYHSWDHIKQMFVRALQHGWTQPELLLAVLFHDAVYDPLAGPGENEAHSADLFEAVLRNHTGGKKPKLQGTVRKLILGTVDHIPFDETSRRLIELDLHYLTQGSEEEALLAERQIEKEYQCFDWLLYKEKRMEFLEGFRSHPMCMEHNQIDTLIRYIRSLEPKIAVYAGSFNPFHKGHLNILGKAEQIFDKVIVAQGWNPEKSRPEHPLPVALRYRQTASYDGLLSAYLKSLGYPVTLVRGLRDATDLQTESVQYRFLQDLMPGIRVVYLFCDKEFEHISSAAIRVLARFGEEKAYLV